MKKLITASICFAGALTYVACVDYSEPATVSEAGAPASRPALITEEAGAPALPTPAPAPAADAGTRADPVVPRRSAERRRLPGTTKCECGPADVCCMQKIRRADGACTSLSECRALALQCDGPEDCDGGVCCLEDRTAAARRARPRRAAAWASGSVAPTATASTRRPAALRADRSRHAGDRRRGLDGSSASAGSDQRSFSNEACNANQTLSMIVVSLLAASCASEPSLREAVAPVAAKESTPPPRRSRRARASIRRTGGISPIRPLSPPLRYAVRRAGDQ